MSAPSLLPGEHINLTDGRLVAALYLQLDGLLVVFDPSTEETLRADWSETHGAFRVIDTWAAESGWQPIGEGGHS